MGNPRNLGVLIGNAFIRINHKNRNITAFHRGNGTDNTEALNLFLDLALAAHACRINKDIFLSVDLNGGIHRISRCSGNIADNQPVLPKNLINERGFANIGLADDGNTDRVILFLLCAFIREIRNHLIQHIPQT